MSKEDSQLKDLFADLAEPVVDAGFTQVVLRRIERRRWVRAAVFALAGGAGGLLALWELRALREVLAAASINIPVGWLPLDWITANPFVVGTAFLAALLALGMGAVEDS